MIRLEQVLLLTQALDHHAKRHALQAFGHRGGIHRPRLFVEIDADLIEDAVIAQVKGEWMGEFFPHHMDRRRALTLQQNGQHSAFDL